MYAVHRRNERDAADELKIKYKNRIVYETKNDDYIYVWSFMLIAVL